MIEKFTTHALMTFCVTGLLMAPGVAQARPPMPLAPPCAQYGFAGNSQIVEPTTGWQVNFVSTGKNATGPGTASNPARGESKTGTMSGFINGKNVRVSINYANRQRQTYRGVVGENGVASGATDNGITNESGKPFTLVVACL